MARAAIEAGVAYVDIADARDFVCGIGELDAAARAQDVLVVSGASSVPALSSAVVDAFAGEFGALHAIEIGIAASGRLPGPATVAGALSCCGRPCLVWHEGAWERAAPEASPVP